MDFHPRFKCFKPYYFRDSLLVWHFACPRVRVNFGPRYFSQYVYCHHRVALFFARFAAHWRRPPNPLSLQRWTFKISCARLRVMIRSFFVSIILLAAATRALRRPPCPLRRLGWGGGG